MKAQANTFPLPCRWIRSAGSTRKGAFIAMKTDQLPFDLEKALTLAADIASTHGVSVHISPQGVMTIGQAPDESAATTEGKPE